MNEDKRAVVCDYYLHKSSKLLSNLVENATSKRSVLGLTVMAPPARRSGSAEHKVRHRRIEEEKIIEEMYKFGKVLGQGSFGIVVEAKNLETNERWAIKKVNKEKAGSSAITLLEREVVILKKVKHDHIIHLEEVFETPRKVYLVMELCELGELKRILFKQGALSEVSTRHVIHDLAHVIMYLHRNGIVHRDLKLENILIASCTTTDDDHPLYEIKLTDFGLSVVKGGAGSDSLLHSSCGTPVYMAPEIIQNHDYSQQCDNWSIGVIMYALLSREFPFVAAKEERLFEIIKRGKVEFAKPIWKEISNSAKSLICTLLTNDPAHRCTASEVTTHSWVQGSTDDTVSNPPNVLKLMKVYAEEMAKNCDEPDDISGDFNHEEKHEELMTESSKRPGTIGSAVSSVSEKTHFKKCAKSAPLSSQNFQKNHSPHRTLTDSLQPPKDLASRRGRLPVFSKSPTKKSTSLTGSPRKIYDNKSIGSQSSPTSSNQPVSKFIRSPVHSAKERGNGCKLSSVDQNNLVPVRIKQDLSNQRLSARPITPGSSSSYHHGGQGKAKSPQPPHSPLLNHGQFHDNPRTGSLPANKFKKKKQVSSAKP